MIMLIIKMIPCILWCALFTFLGVYVTILEHLFSQLYWSYFLTNGNLCVLFFFFKEMNVCFCCFDWLAMSESCF